METDQRTRTIRKIIDETQWITAEALLARHLMPCPAVADPVSDWKRRGLIFGVTIDGTECFARYQFDATGCPLPVIREILEALGPVGDPWNIAAWFHFPKGWLLDPSCTDDTPRAIAPMDALQRPEEVVAAAQKSRGTYCA
jgi:hypothetical protein